MPAEMDEADKWYMREVWMKLRHVKRLSASEATKLHEFMVDATKPEAPLDPEPVVGKKK